jgi:hypothetical protein
MTEEETTSTEIPTVTRFPLSVETFEEDALGLEPFCRSLESYLMVDHDFVEGSLVVSLNAEFGFGKSTFLKMWENDLNTRSEEEATTPLAINLNAWESDYCDEPLLPIISALIEAIKAKIDTPDDDTKFQKLKDAAKDVAWFTVGIGNSIVKEAFKVDPFAAGKITQEKRDARKQTPTDLLDAYQKRRHALWNLKESLAEYFGGEQPRAFIFIDELDRCRPDYAVSYLETIKHVFDIHGLVFVLAVDYAHLENSAKSLYGPDLKFPEYFRKFVHRSFELPEPSDVNRSEFARRLTEYYLHNKRTRFTRLKLQESFDCLPDLISALEMTPRQAMEFFRIMGHLSSNSEEPKGSLSVGYSIGMMIISAFKVSKPELYQQLGAGKTPHSEVIQLFKDAYAPDDAQWWSLVYLSGFSDVSHAYALLKEANLLPDKATETSINELAEHYTTRIWGRSMYKNHYSRFHAMVEVITHQA